MKFLLRGEIVNPEKKPRQKAIIPRGVLSMWGNTLS
jgi:hypothetical protein